MEWETVIGLEIHALNVAHQYQQTTDWHQRTPAGFE